MTEPVLTKRTYLAAWVILLALTLLTVLLGYLRLGPFNMIIGIGIAAIQACIIGGIFMHAAYDIPLVRVVTAGAVIWFLIEATLTLTDYITRGWLPFPGK